MLMSLSKYSYHKHDSSNSLNHSDSKQVAAIMEIWDHLHVGSRS